MQLSSVHFILESHKEMTDFSFKWDLHRSCFKSIRFFTDDTKVKPVNITTIFNDN